MADDVTAVLRYTDADGVEHTVTTVSNAESYMNKFSAAYGEVTWDLIRSINDFGYYMQRYLCDHSAQPWTLGVEHKAMEKAYMTHGQYTANKSTYLDEMKDMQKIWDTNSNIDKVNYSLVLESDTSINFKIKMKDGYTGRIRVLLGGRLVSPARLSDGRLQVTASGISAHLLGTPHIITVTTSSGTATYIASVLSYDYECMGKTKTDSEFDAMCALYEYYKATIAYRDSLQ